MEEGDEPLVEAGAGGEEEETSTTTTILPTACLYR